MRLHWFSPLPPCDTGIAEFSRGLLPALSRKAELVVWTDRPFDPALQKAAEIRTYRPDLTDFPWREVNGTDDLCVYQLGNNWHFHASIWEASRQHPGLVVLHDWSLHDLFFMVFNHVRGDPDGYAAWLRALHGEAGARSAARFRAEGLDQDARSRFPLTGLAFEGAAGVVVHTGEALDQARWLTPAPVHFVPLAFADDSVARARQAPRDRPVELVVFGHLGGNRRLDRILAALASLESRARFRLSIYGAIADEAPIRERIARLGLSAQVQLHGPVSDERLERGLDAADLAINLRYPTMGEASGSQLRIWSHALPSLVTRVGWYARLPADTVAFVNPETELVDLHRHLEAYLRDPEPFLRMGRAGKARLAAHAPELYVDRLLEAAEAARGFLVEGVRAKLARRVASVLPAVDPEAMAARLFPPRTSPNASPRAEQLEALRHQLTQAAAQFARALEDTTRTLDELAAFRSP